MANRYAPYKARWLSREPRRLVCKFKHNTNAEQLPNDFSSNATYGNPFNMGIYSVQRTAAGIYKFHLGSMSGNNTSGHDSTSKDTYAHLAGVNVTFAETSGLSAFVSNDQASNATTPFVQLTFEVADGSTDTNVSENTIVEFTFFDSKD